jgi:hypothetical protein
MKLSTLFKISITVLAIWLVTSQIDYNLLTANKTVFDMQLIIFSSLLILFQVLLGSCRWQLNLKAMRESIPFSKILTNFYI